MLADMLANKLRALHPELKTSKRQLLSGMM